MVNPDDAIGIKKGSAMKPTNIESRSLARVACLTAATLSAALLAACSPAQSSPAPSAPPPVQVENPRVSSLADSHEFVGRVEAIQSVDIRPRVSGQILRITFSEGAQVRKGDLLAQIDPRPYQAVIDRARAALSKAKAEAELAALEAQRAAKLEALAAMSTEDAQRRQAAAAVAAAQVQAAEAALAAAQLDMDFTEIRAPISGRIGRADVSVGNLVTADPGARPITTLVSSGAAYVAFDVNDSIAARVLKSINGRPKRRPSVRLATPQGEPLNVPAELAFTDNRIGERTGTLRLRARVTDAPQLVPGAFVRVGLAFDLQQPTLLIDDKAVGVDQDKRYVLVVDGNDTVQYRPVELGARHGELRAIRQGLSENDRVVIDGLAYARAGMKVTPLVSDAANRQETE